MSDMGSEVASFYRGRSVFITGASGFIGKVLLEKLIRSCPGVTTIYVLIRPKKGNDVKTRMEELLNAKLFDSIRHDRPAALMKVVPIIGDITLPNLGISNADVAMLQENVSVVFHSAATVRFDEPLKKAAILNIVGTRSIIEICKNMTKLAAIIHVSTAYCNCQQKELEEVVYPAPADPEKFIDWIQWMDEDVINQITPKILGGRPNTYTYTKALAEQLFYDMAGSLPAAIIRPSIVTAGWKEPVEGWVDNLNGPTGLITGIGKGVLRSILCDDRLICDMVPVDILSNLMITVAWRTSNARSNNMMVYNCTSSTVNPIKWKGFKDVLGPYMCIHPFREVLWYPGGSMKRSKFIHDFQVQTTHIFPAYIMDAVATVIGKKPFFVNLQEKIWKAVGALEYFTTQEWRFSCKNTQQLYSQLTVTDKQLFNFDISQVKWDSYLITYFEGVRKYILKESKNDPTSNIRKMYIIHRVVQILTIFALLKMARIGAPPVKKIFYTMLNLSLYTARYLTFRQ